MVALHLTPMASHKQDASNLESDRLPKENTDLTDLYGAKKAVGLIVLTNSIKWLGDPEDIQITEAICLTIYG